jgi:hypothetical protein
VSELTLNTTVTVKKITESRLIIISKYAVYSNSQLLTMWFEVGSTYTQLNSIQFHKETKLKKTPNNGTTVVTGQSIGTKSNRILSHVECHKVLRDDTRFSICL